MRNIRYYAVVIALLLLFLIFVSCAMPLLGGSELPEAYTEAIRSQSEDLYSKKLLLVPILVRVESFDGQTVCYTIYYFPAGSVGMSYCEQDGYNIEKPLSRI